MSLHKGSTKIKDLYIGSTKIGELYHGSTLVYKSCAYDVDEVVFESDVAGTYSLNLLEDGQYEVYCIAGGGGATTGGRYRANGASGGGYHGIIIIYSNSYEIVVGKAGENNTRTGQQVAIGGISSIGNLIIAKSQNSGGHDSTYNAANSTGICIINATVISTDYNKAGNNGGVSYGGSWGLGLSVYDNTHTGYGAGCGGSNPISNFPEWNAVSGYVKIVYKGKIPS